MMRLFQVLCILIFVISIGCAGKQGADGGGFDASICKNIEGVLAMDPESKAFKISCADLERCTSIMGWNAPPNVPCTGP